MITDFNDSTVDLSSGDDFKHTTKATHDDNDKSKPRPAIVTSTENNQSNPNSSEVRTRKKSVRFDDDVSIYRLDGLCASEPSTASEEKKTRWYDHSDFDAFKHEAAAEAGVKIIPCDKGNRFTMAGDFDQKCDEGDAGGPSDDAAKKLYYNENEYGDSLKRDGAMTCKRGLGYHFSRNRKKSRAAARSAVLAWQKMLRDPTDPKVERILPTLGGGADGVEKTRAVVALVSAKCSRVAREEARWRGDVDYRVAHPERHALAARAAAATSGFGTNEKDDSACISSGPMKKRMRHSENLSPISNDARCKRQRLSGGCLGVGDRLSPAPAGMLRAEV